ncbi:hypothetical protein ABMA27_004127 [Loxostege sticticalis]|uniref:MADF domain-containing protein n=1 Tax=Loxostege sticticalis TaxID=481309 RepID=A0ABR3HMG0_LOXSC
MEDRLPILMEEFISLIETHPVLWDKSLEDYKNRIATQNAWKEILLTMYPDYETWSEKDRQECAKKIVKKWTHIRDTFIKSEKKIQYQKMCGSGAKTARPYLYHKQLIFLRKVIQPTISAPCNKISGATNKEDTADADNLDIEVIYDIKQEDTADSSDDEALINIKDEYTVDDGASSLKSNDSSIQHYEPQVQPSTSTASMRKRLSSNVSPADAKMIKFMDSYPSRVEQFVEVPLNNMINRHVSFFNGLIPTLEKFDDDQVIDFQLGVIQLMKNIKNRNNT